MFPIPSDLTWKGTHHRVNCQDRELFDFNLDSFNDLGDLAQKIFTQESVKARYRYPDGSSSSYVKNRNRVIV